MTPGSVAWLLRHEVRLALRGTGKASWRARAGPLLLLAAVQAVGGIALAVVLALAMRHGDPAPRHLLRDVVPFLSAGLIGLLVLMLSTAAVAVLRTFHDRGDLDLLLSAPVPAARVLAAKAAGVGVTVAAPFVIIAGPFLLTFAAFGHPRLLGTLAMIAVDAALATALAILLVGQLFGTIGPRAARVVVQLVAALLGATVFLASQAVNLAPALAHRMAGAIARPWPAPLDWPGRAALGAPGPLVALAAVAAAAAWLAPRAASRQLLATGQAGGRVAARTSAVRFRTGLVRVVVAKELRLIARDPELITQIALRLVYLIPMAALLLRSKHGVDPGPAIAAAATGFAALLASSLAWLVVAAEDAPDLLAAAPRDAAAIARAKLVAATLVPLALVGVAAAGAAATGARAAGVTLVLGTVAAVSGALLQAWFGRPAPRAAFRRRQSGSFVVAVGEIVLAGAWSATASLLVRGSPWALAPALLAGLIMAGAIEARSATGN